MNSLRPRPLSGKSVRRNGTPVHVVLTGLALACLFSWSGLPLQGAQNPLTAEEIIDRVVERVKATELQGKSKRYTYSRVSVVEDLDDQGKVEERKEKTYEMVPVSGAIYQRLIQVNGKPLSEKERKQEAEKELKFRQRQAQSQPNKGEDRQRIILGRELVSRFQFRIQDREIVAGRPAYVLSFAPKPGAAEKKVDDRVLSRLAGKLWIDEQEFEMARIEFHLTEKLSIGWGGVLASLQKFAFTLTRIRLPDGVWFNHLFSGDLEGRKLLGALRLKIQDRASDFKELPASLIPIVRPLPQ